MSLYSFFFKKKYFSLKLEQKLIVPFFIFENEIVHDSLRK